MLSTLSLVPDHAALCAAISAPIIVNTSPTCNCSDCYETSPSQLRRIEPVNCEATASPQFVDRTVRHPENANTGVRDKFRQR